MTNAEKLSMVKTLLQVTGTAEDTNLNNLLTISEHEILSWRYSGRGSIPASVPSEYEMIQIYAVVAGYGMIGAEGQKNHNENGINRSFSYPDMVHYIHHNVIPYAKVIG